MPSAPLVPASFWVRAAGAVGARPRLWATALRQARRVARPRWWRRPPFLPLPDRDYLAFRFETQYGSGGAAAARDVVEYLEWCREMERGDGSRSAATRRR